MHCCVVVFLCLVVIFIVIIENIGHTQSRLGFLRRASRGCCHRHPVIVTGLLGILHAHIHIALGIVYLVMKFQILLVLQHLVEAFLNTCQVGMLLSGAGSNIDSGIELHHIVGPAFQHLLEIFRRRRTLVEGLIYLSHNEIEACLGMMVACLVKGKTNVLHRFLVFLLRQNGLYHSKIELIVKLGGKITLRLLVDQLVQRHLGIDILLLLRKAARQQDFGLIRLRTARILGDYQATGVGCGGIILLLEGSVGCQQVTVFHILYIFAPL